MTDNEAKIVEAARAYGVAWRAWASRCHAGLPEEADAHDLVVSRRNRLLQLAGSIEPEPQGKEAEKP